MHIYEITGFETGISDAGVNFLQPGDSYQNLVNGFIYHQVLQSRQGIDLFAPRLANGTRVMGIFEHILPDSSKELLVVDTQNLYKYNTSTGEFDLIPFGGSLLAAGYTGFGITLKDAYVSGTSYPTATNTARFVFTGEGMSLSNTSSGIFFYDGSTVQNFTNVGDNPNYAEPLDPATNPPVAGVLTIPRYVIYFGERLNFFAPRISGVRYNQAVLYSGIRAANGNGDKFNVVGSGQLSGDTYEIITGAVILGQIIAINFNRSNWTLEKTRDAFNPYFIRKVPSVEGTDAKFSAVSWFNTVRSIGKTGVIGTDGRQSIRVDNKIPNFTADQIDQIDFNLTYGGFDRVNNQYLWSYLQSEVDSTTQSAVLVNNYEEETWSVFELRLSVFGQTDLGRNIPWEQIDETTVPENPSWAQWNTTEEIWNKIGLANAVQKTLAGDDLGFIYDINADYDDYVTAITGVTNANPAVLTIDASAFKDGDRVVVQSVEGMEIEAGVSGINNFDPTVGVDETNFTPYTISNATPTSVEINLDSSDLTAYISGGTLSKVISFEAETIPFNPYRSIGRRCYISHVEFLLDVNGGYLKVDVYQDEQTNPFKENILVIPRSLPNQAAREWITMTVDNEANFMTFVLKQESPAVQMRMTSMRIHCSPAGLTSG